MELVCPEPRPVKKLRPRQIRAILSLFEHSTVSKALLAAGIPRRTFYKWCEDPIFRDAIETERQRLYEQGRGRLEKLFSEAIDTLEDLLKSDRDDVRRLAAVSIVGNVLRIKELEMSDRVRDFLMRLEELTDYE